MANPGTTKTTGEDQSVGNDTEIIHRKGSLFKQYRHDD